MRISLVAVGTKMPAWVQTGFKEYQQRINGDLSLVLHEIAPVKRTKSTSEERIRHEEGQRILSAIPDSALTIALDVTGRQYSTEQLSEQIQQWMLGGRNVALIVGGPDGLSAECLQRSEQRWSLSALTFPHPLVRVVLAEQIYRAWSILKGHPYHRAG